MAAAFLLSAPSAWAVISRDSGDPAHNTTAPTGPYASAGWQYQGYLGRYLATAIGPHDLVTAAHIGVQSGPFVQDSLFTASTTASYTLDSRANGGLGYYDVPGTDLRVYKTVETLASWAPLYTGSSELGHTLFLTGRGGPRGAALGSSGGWYLGASDLAARWGTNVVAHLSAAGGAPAYLVADFDPIAGVDEAFLSAGDSGGASFLQQPDGSWALAGIHYGIDGPFSASADGSSPFFAATSDTSGLFIRSGAAWVASAGPTSFYDSRISPAVATLAQIVATPVPEPSVAAAAGAAGVLGFLSIFRQRR